MIRQHCQSMKRVNIIHIHILFLFLNLEFKLEKNPPNMSHITINIIKYLSHGSILSTYLYKISDIQLFQRHIQIQCYIATPRYFPLMMLL